MALIGFVRRKALEMRSRQERRCANQRDFFCDCFGFPAVKHIEERPHIAVNIQDRKKFTEDFQAFLLAKPDAGSSHTARR